MITVPNRLTSLVQMLEAGTDPSPDQIRRIGQLQALDLANAGQDFAAEAMQRDNDMTEQFRQS